LGNILTRLIDTAFSRRALCHAVCGHFSEEQQIEEVIWGIVAFM
jgi:hypothetical protein